MPRILNYTFEDTILFKRFKSVSMASNYSQLAHDTTQIALLAHDLVQIPMLKKFFKQILISVEMPRILNYTFDDTNLFQRV